MMPDSATLLKQLLAAAPRQQPATNHPAASSEPSIKPLPAVRWTNDSAALLERLLRIAPRIVRPRRKVMLFEAIGVLNLENPHSDFIAWLLDPLGPLTDMWLLRMLLAHIAPEHEWPGTPTVEREVSSGNGRADIVVSWADAYKLVIENKVWSQEGDRQVARYLDDFEINCNADGCVVFLSPSGHPPASVAADHPCVVAMSYRELAGLIDEGLNQNKEPDDRGRVMALEFRNGIHRLLKLRYDMAKSAISESTKIFLNKGRRLVEIKELAIEESAEFLDWIYSEAERRLKPILGEAIIAHRWEYGCLYRLPTWKNHRVQFGPAFGNYCNPRKRLISEVEPASVSVGVDVMTLDGDEAKGQCGPISERLHPVLKKAWPHASDLDDPTYSWPLWRDFPLPADGDYDRWAEDMLTFIEGLAAKVTPAISKAAMELAKGR